MLLKPRNVIKNLAIVKTVYDLPFSSHFEKRKSTLRVIIGPYQLYRESHGCLKGS